MEEPENKQKKGGTKILICVFRRPNGDKSGSFPSTSLLLLKFEQNNETTSTTKLTEQGRKICCRKDQRLQAKEENEKKKKAKKQTNLLEAVGNHRKKRFCKDFLRILQITSKPVLE